MQLWKDEASEKLESAKYGWLLTAAIQTGVYFIQSTKASEDKLWALLHAISILFRPLRVARHDGAITECQCMPSTHLARLLRVGMQPTSHDYYFRDYIWEKNLLTFFASDFFFWVTYLQAGLADDPQPSGLLPVGHLPIFCNSINLTRPDTISSMSHRLTYIYVSAPNSSHNDALAIQIVLQAYASPRSLYECMTIHRVIIDFAMVTEEFNYSISSYRCT